MKKKVYAYIFSIALALNTSISVGAVNVYNNVENVGKETDLGLEVLSKEENEKAIENDEIKKESVSQNALQSEENIEINTFTGKGTEEDPYQINNKEDLIALADLKESISGYYILNNDIDLSGENWSMIGNLGYFTGDFNGNHKRITGLSISDNSYSGLFAKNQGVIYDLKVEGKITNGTSYTGMLCAYNDGGTIKNCQTSGEITNSQLCGGLVGFHTGSTALISECSSSVTVNAYRNTNYAGGLVGHNHDGSICNSYATGNVDNANISGGLIGSCSGSSSASKLGLVSYCYATGLASGYINGGLIGGTESNGGIVYSEYGEIKLYNCYYNSKNLGNMNGYRRTLEQMKNQITYYDWDFEHIWSINENVNDGFPYIEKHDGVRTVTISGDGSERNPYKIENEKQMAAMMDGRLSVEAGTYYVLANDIILTAENWPGIDLFQGNLDGSGHTIKGLRSTLSRTKGLGLIRENTGVIKNLTIDGLLQDGLQGVGMLCQTNKGTIDNCHATGEITTTEVCGGLVSINEGIIKNSDSSVTIQST